MSDQGCAPQEDANPKLWCHRTLGGPYILPHHVALWSLSFSLGRLHPFLCRRGNGMRTSAQLKFVSSICRERFSGSSVTCRGSTAVLPTLIMGITITQEDESSLSITACSKSCGDKPVLPSLMQLLCLIESKKKKHCKLLNFQVTYSSTRGLAEYFSTP